VRQTPQSSSPVERRTPGSLPSPHSRPPAGSARKLHLQQRLAKASPRPTVCESPPHRLGGPAAAHHRARGFCPCSSISPWADRSSGRHHNSDRTEQHRRCNRQGRADLLAGRGNQARQHQRSEPPCEWGIVPHPELYHQPGASPKIKRSSGHAYQAPMAIPRAAAATAGSAPHHK